MKTKQINAIIIDDEEGCIANLRYQLDKHCPDIRVVYTADSLLKLAEKLDSASIDVAFLDVELFDDNIFNTLQQLTNVNFRIVFVTAYEKYAIKAWKVDALDYILKPLAGEDIKDCYLKIKKHFDATNYIETAADQAVAVAHHTKNKKIILKDNDKIYVIKTEDILFISGNGFYSSITFLLGGLEKSVIISKPLNKIEAEYTPPEFYRVHKSYIINITGIAGIVRDEGTSVKMKNDKLIPVAKRRINEFLSFLNHAD